MIEAHFNMPARPIDLAPLIRDMHAAKKRVHVVSAYFTSTLIAETFAALDVPEKVVILNAADKARPGAHAAIELVRAANIRDNKDSPWDGYVHILGSNDWKEGVMHCKYMLADDVLWVGSYNFTYQAKSNYEVLLRIEDRDVAEVFAQQSQRMIDDWLLWQGTTQCASVDGAFRCVNCERICPTSELGEDGSTWMCCKRCTTERVGR